jgi:hypothetical protein
LQPVSTASRGIARLIKPDRIIFAAFFVPISRLAGRNAAGLRQGDPSISSFRSSSYLAAFALLTKEMLKRRSMLRSLEEESAAPEALQAEPDGKEEV